MAHPFATLRWIDDIGNVRFRKRLFPNLCCAKLAG